MVNVPLMRLHDRFLPHFIEWYAANKQRHRLLLNMELQRPLHRVQRRAVERALRAGASHVLFVEDDHFGFPVDGLDALLSEDKDVIGFQTFRKSYPFASLARRKIDPSVSAIIDPEEDVRRYKNLRPHDRGDGPLVQRTDILTWAFTLVRTEVFVRMIDAGKHPFLRWDTCPTDSVFCQYCEDLGIDRYVHFGFPIGHGQYDPRELDLRREIENEVARARINYERSGRCQVPEEMPAALDIEEMVRTFHAHRRQTA